MRNFCRSLLNTCALKPQQYLKAGEVGADVSTIDLEDSVPPDDKEKARRLALPFFIGAPANGFVRALRINSLSCHDGLLDILALRQSGARPDALMLPKIESARDIAVIEGLLTGHLESVGLFPILESPEGLAAVEEIAAASPRIWGMVFGAADFTYRAGVLQSRENLSYSRARIVWAACRAGIPAIDAPCFDLGQEGVLRAEVEHARAIGFRGKVAIHPKQVGFLNQVFSEPRDEARQAG